MGSHQSSMSTSQRRNRFINDVSPSTENSAQIKHDSISPFETLNDDNLREILSFVGEESYVSYGLVNQRCNKIFDTYNLEKVSNKYRYAPLDLLIKTYSQKKRIKFLDECDQTFLRRTMQQISHAIVFHDRLDLLGWALSYKTTPDCFLSYEILLEAARSHQSQQDSAIKIMRTVFYHSDQRAQHFYRRKFNIVLEASESGNLLILKWLYKKNFHFSTKAVYKAAKTYSHSHVLNWLLEEYVEYDQHHSDYYDEKSSSNRRKRSSSSSERSIQYKQR